MEIIWNGIISIGWKSFEEHIRNVVGKGYLSEIPDRHEEHIIGNWKKGNLFYKVTQNLA